MNIHEDKVKHSSNLTILFSERLVTAMNLRDISNKQLAQKIFVAPSTISSYRTGHRIPNLEQLILISTTLQVSSDYLLGLSDSITKE